MADIRYATLILDDFNRANENPVAYPWIHSTNWDLAMELNNNFIRSPSNDPNNQAFSYWSGEPFSGDIESWGECVGNANLHDSFYFGLVTADPQNGYTCRMANTPGDDFWVLRRMDNGVSSILATGTVEGLPAQPNLCLMQISGSVISCYVSTDAGANWTLKVSASDSTYRTDLFAGFGGQGAPGWDNIGGGPPDELPQIYRRPTE